MKKIEDSFGDWSAVTGVTADSRLVKPGMIFVATHGHLYMDQAAQSGALWIVGEEPATENVARIYSQVPDARRALSRLAAAFYKNPSHPMLVVGVTGTSGKTTTTYLIESILKSAGYEVGLIGTVNFRYKGKVLDSTHTTPGAVELQALFREMKDAGCTAVVMEVSSHALKQCRAADIAFDGMVFTNLTPEHLDFHLDMEDYYLSKKILFSEIARNSRATGKEPVAAVGTEGEYGRRLVKEIDATETFKAIASFDCHDAQGAKLKPGLDGIHGEVDGIAVDSELTGGFNVSNILGAVAVTRGLGISAEAISDGIRSLKKVPGRLESVPNPHGMHVLVDYAHKPDALEKVLHTLKGIKASGRLITVFGCGGDRDRLKRPVMGKLAVEQSDRVFITSDNPRTENPQAIIEEILEGTKGHTNFSVEADRRKAIQMAIDEARSGDIVLIAGKGHEDYQIIGTTKTHFDDREIAAQFLSQKKCGAVPVYLAAALL